MLGRVTYTYTHMDHGAGFTEQGLRSRVYNSRPIVYENEGAKVCAKFECWALAPLRFQADDG